MILSFLATVLRRVVGPDGPSVGSDGGGPIPASSYPVLKTVTDLEAGITILRASRTSPPLIGSPEVAQFAIRSGNVVRSDRVPEAKLVPHPGVRRARSTERVEPLGSVLARSEAAPAAGVLSGWSSLRWEEACWNRHNDAGFQLLKFRFGREKRFGLPTVAHAAVAMRERRLVDQTGIEPVTS